MHLGLTRGERGKNSSEPDGLLHQVAAHPVPTRRRGIPLVEDEVDDLEHRGEPRGEVGTGGDLDRHAVLAQRALRARDALADGRLGGEVGARDLTGRESGDHPQRQRDSRLRGEHRVARSEDESEHVVVDVVEGGVEVGLGRVGRPQLLRVPHLLQLAREVDVAADAVDGAASRRRGEPGPGLVGHPVARPLFERLHEGVLREVLGESDVADDARDDRGDLGGLHAPDRLDGAAHRLDVVVRCRGGWHPNTLARGGVRLRSVLPPSVRAQDQAVSCGRGSRA